MGWALLLLIYILPVFGQPNDEELNTRLMQSTFKIFGPDVAKPGNVSFGTVFFMGIPLKDDPTKGSGVLVTAAHVLDGIAGDTATLVLRHRNAQGVYTTFNFDFKIREQGKPRYLKHDTADVAVMYSEAPQQLSLTVLPPRFLAEDKLIEELEIHPGDEVLCLGFPLLAEGFGGFPLLRGGRLASYPLTPSKSVKEWEFDVLLYGGNSGGPVYFSYENRPYGGKAHFGTVRGVLGLVTQQVNSSIPGFSEKPLNYGVIVPAQFIRETIDRLQPVN